MRISHSIAIIFLLTLLTACYNYKPGYINSPKFEKGGELKVDFNAGSSYGGNLSYSPVKNLAFQSNFSTNFGLKNPSDRQQKYVNQDEELSSRYHFKNLLYEFGAGAYWEYSDQFYQDFYVGFGHGQMANNDFSLFLFSSRQDLVAYQNTFDNIFLQSSFKFQANNNISLSLDGRINRLQFYDINFVYTEGYDRQGKPTIPEESNRKDFFNDKERFAYQLGVSSTVKLDHFSLYFQFHFAFANESYYNYDFYSVRPINWATGISIPINQFWEK